MKMCKLIQWDWGLIDVTDLADIRPNIGLLSVRLLFVDMRPFGRMRYARCR